MNPRIPQIDTPFVTDDGSPNATWFRYFLELQKSIPAGGIPDAPQDGTTYGRRDGAWTQVGGARVDLGYTPAATQGTVTNSAGDDAVLPRFTEAAAGLVPAPITPGTTRFLREDGTWQAVGGGGGVQVDVFTANGTWNKPAGAQLVRAICVGGGGGGGSGGHFPAGPNAGAGGGGSGGGGALRDWTMDAVTVPSSVAITVGAGGTGGARANTLVGNPGTAGGASSFGSLLIAYGGGAGGAGQNTTVGGGGGGGLLGAGQNGTVGNNGVGGLGGGGNAGETNPTMVVGGGSGGWRGAPDVSGGSSAPALFGPQGGGSGGAGRPIASMNAGGAAYEFGKNTPTVAGGTSTGGSVPITNGASVAGIAPSLCGAGGGGGGGGQLSGTGLDNAGDGGAGQQPGGGGGGGGGVGGNFGGFSGAGGNGGDGIVVVMSYF